MFKSIEFDDYVVAGINNVKLNFAEWQSELPPDLRAKVVAIVEAANWNELPQGATAAAMSPSLRTNETLLTGTSAFCGITGITAIVCGVVFGFLFESTVVVYLCFTVAILGIGTAVFLQSRHAKGYGAAFGIAPTPKGSLSRGDFVKNQMAIAETLRVSACFGSCVLLVSIVWILGTVDQKTFGADDSVVTASLRSAGISLIPMMILSTWNSWKKRGTVYGVARCLRGFLTRNLSPFWVSWLYEGKSKLAKPDVSERIPPTIKQVAIDNSPLLAFFLFCIVFLANTQWLDGVTQSDVAHRVRNGKCQWVTDLAIWMFEHPTSTLFISAPLASIAIASFSHQLSTSIIPQFAGRISIVVFFLSILLFAVIGAA